MTETTETEETPAEDTAPPPSAHEKNFEKGDNDPLDFPMADIELRAKNIRSSIPDIENLKASIKAEGILEPLIAVRQPDGFKVELIAGYSRYYAAKELGLVSVPVRIITADENRRHRIAVIENLQRNDMNPLDKATSLADLIANEGIEQKEAAKKLGVSEGFISQHLALLKLPKKIQGAVRSGSIDLAQARQLCRVKDEEAALEFLRIAPDFTSAGLMGKIDLYVQKIKEKEAKAAEAEKAKAKSARKAKLGIKDDDDDEIPKTLADEYSSKKLEPLKKTDLTEALKFYANKLERAEAPAKKAEYKGILKGLEIASGLQEFTP